MCSSPSLTGKPRLAFIRLSRQLLLSQKVTLRLSTRNTGNNPMSLTRHMNHRLISNMNSLPFPRISNLRLNMSSLFRRMLSLRQ
jgi:hypothetical protein